MTIESPMAIIRTIPEIIFLEDFNFWTFGKLSH